MMDSVQDGELDLDYYARILEDAEPIDFFLNNSPSDVVEFDASFANIFTQGNTTEKVEFDTSFANIITQVNATENIEFDSSFVNIIAQENTSEKAEFDASFSNSITQENTTRKRERGEKTVKQGSKAYREKMRRNKMNERFSELSKLLEPGRLVKTDKSAILDDAIRVLNQLKAEAKELEEVNTKLEEDIKTLKEDKNELREEKSQMKTEKEKIEKRVESMLMIPAGYVPPPQYPTAYHPGVNKMIAFPSHGAFPMWQWMPPAACDVSKDHELRPPMA